MNGIVIYKSRYGATEQYAKWIAEGFNLPLKSCDENTVNDITNYDFLILGSPIYMGSILMKQWIAANESILKGKTLFIFIVGAAPLSEKEKTNAYFSNNISEGLLATSKTFYLQGKSIFSELQWSDKFFLKVGAMFTKDPKDKKAMLTDFNAIDKRNLEDLMGSVRKILTL